jgi:diguanylate cyclase (GGDEF)-like protein
MGSMGALSSSTGIALVVPGYFICAGILLFAAVVAVVLGVYRGRASLYFAFAAACLASAGTAVATASYYLADSIAGGIAAQRYLATATLLVTAALVAFIAFYTEARGQRRSLAILGALIGVSIVANHVLPNGVRYDSIDAFGWIHLPWGESIFRIEGVAGAWSFFYRGVTVAVAAWCLWQLARFHRAGHRRAAMLLAFCLSVLLLASLQGALIDLGVLRTFHYSGFALVGLALLAGAGLMVRLHEQNAELQATAEQLRAENELRRDAEATIRERAYRDGLTGLPNRAYVQDHLAAFLVAGRASAFGAVLVLDLDHFKVVNDGLSHEVGDELLREVSARLRAIAPAAALLARIGGDEFMIALEDTSSNEDEVRASIEILADNVTRVFSQPLGAGARSLNLFASIGVATFEVPGTSPAEILQRAGMALNRAKKRGRNNVQRFVPGLQRDATERFRIVEGLRRAVDSNELALRYQPVVTSDGRPAGAEALMRWHAPGGDVSPGRFIPIAEETGLIHALGEWSLREGCLKLAGWRARGIAFDGCLSINVSPWQLARPDFVARTRAILEASGVPPKSLCLEITESAVLFDVDETVAKLRELRPLGVRIALDDFGTGYSSLALLKDLPLDTIKIDQSFVRRLDEGANQHLVRVVVAIGAELGLDVIAEGIETETERLRLVELGVTRMQGFLFARAMPEDEFLAWLADPQARRGAQAPSPGVTV